MLKVHDDKYMICEGVHMDWFSIDEHTMFDQLGVIIFGSVRFLSKKSNQTEFFSKKTKTDRFRFGSVF